MDADGPRGDLRGHARVAVAVAADPAAGPQERPDARRPRPRPPGVRRGRRRAAGRRVQGGVERPVQPRDDREQRRVEERHRGPDLVERRRADDAQVGRPPQQRDLLAQAAPDLAVVGRGQPRVVQPGEQHRAAAERDERRPAARLGRVGGEDRRDDEPGDQRVELRVRPAQPPQPGDRVRHRIVEDAVARRPLAPSQRPHPAARLGQVDEAEVERERLDDGLRVAEVERLELVVEARPFGRVVVASEGDRPASDAFDGGEQLRAGLLGDDLAEQRAEQPDLARERVARARPSRSRAARRRPHRRRAAPVAASRGRSEGTVPGPSRHRAATVSTATFL